MARDIYFAIIMFFGLISHVVGKVVSDYFDRLSEQTAEENLC